MDFHSKDSEDTKGLMDALGFKKFSVFGYSNGGMIGICLAAMYPDAVEKLVIMGTNTLVAEDDAKLYQQHKDLQGERLERRSNIWQRMCI